ncbi:MAG: 5-oxoprolinase [Gammaproteobacteria bacterium]|nr:5-oxoprolinase [Gammaproteobacteria bacterium]
MDNWQFWIDRGGTFTDIVARLPDGTTATRKLLSDNPEQYADSAIQGMRDLMGLSQEAAIPGGCIDAIKMGTTVATNALLERTGDRTLLLTTRGFGDALRIGYQHRPRLFARNIQLPAMLYERVTEIHERVDAAGQVIVPLDEEEARRELQAACDAGMDAVAILFIHGYRYPAHEKRVAAIAREVGFSQVSISHRVSPLIKLVSRGDTTVVDAYLSPILRRYVGQVASHTGGARLMFMQSHGGLTSADCFQGKDAIVSGPAGGVVGMVRTTQMAGFDKIIGFDMGGTSTDVSHFDGEYERAFETEVAGARIRVPMMSIHTVAAGGGSILKYEDGRFQVGPDSAGANPGPACYRRGGPLTVTDCNLMLGKIQVGHFPRVFGPDGDDPLDRDIVAERFSALAAEVNMTPEQVAEGFLKIAVDNMANAIKKISVQRGYDVTGYTLSCFGGAGGQHACLVADALGMTRIFIHPYAGVLSAYGMGLADLRAIRERSVEAALSKELVQELQGPYSELRNETRQELLQQGVDSEAVTTTCKAMIRYDGTDTALSVPSSDASTMAQAFEEIHKRQFGFVMSDRPLVVEAISVEAAGGGEDLEDPVVADALSGELPEPLETIDTYSGGDSLPTPIFDRSTLLPGNRVIGPAVLVEPNATAVVEPGWAAEITSLNHLLLERTESKPRDSAMGTDADPIMLEIFNNLYMTIAEQMGGVLANTAYSVNIKERLDFSCAVFDCEGRLVANAPHMPVHLGSMSDSIRSVIRKWGDEIREGDVFVLNAPYNGGTHLPDVTVVTPVVSRQQEILFFVASRGHHADIGGITPGSMPPASREVGEEGVLLDNLRLVQQGEMLDAEIREVLLSGPYPVRNLDQNLADLRAQIAANEKGVQELRRMVDQFGLEVVRAYMKHVQDNAEEAVRRVIGKLRSGRFQYPMDNGAVIRVDITVDSRRRGATIDFSGTSDQLENNFNAPASVCRAAALYVFRTLVDEDIPMNEGCLEPLNLIIPDGSMLNPHYPAAVVAGNVETSQAVVDTLFGALKTMGAAQGTMNNFTFGDEKAQYYETLCGGAGAGQGFDGAHAVHTHMTNSRLTDPEVLEWRFPVILESFSIRHGSGGAGRYRGGDGVNRRMRFLRPMTAAILSGHRIIPPYGMQGGRPGKTGRNRVIRRNGEVEELPGCAEVSMNPGDVFSIETPGGGGYGSAPPTNDEQISRNGDTGDSTRRSLRCLSVMNFGMSFEL